ncbi:MAG: HNH endonuclease [Pseudomonadales bacterium]
MNYWWVNQKQTYRHEVPGGYLWSPKLNQAGNRNHSYDLMRTVRPGDIIFSYANSHLKAIGVAQSYCYEYPKPSEFGSVGDYWSNVGWRVDVLFREFSTPIRTMDHISSLRSMLPDTHSPIQPETGRGNQAYLFKISRVFASGLAQLADRWVLDLVNGNYALDVQPDRSVENLFEWENRVEQSIINDTSLLETEKATLVMARRGQGLFRDRLLQIESCCRITQVSNTKHLIASHTKPWRDCANEERLDPENGFMLTPTVDHLFDKGFIGFEDSGELIVSSVSDRLSLNKMSIPVDRVCRVGNFTEGQREYLNWHRKNILLV